MTGIHIDFRKALAIVPLTGPVSRDVAVLLEATVRVLAEEGAQRFITAGVGEKAGVSVGSPYQIFREMPVALNDVAFIEMRPRRCSGQPAEAERTALEPVALGVRHGQA